MRGRLFVILAVGVSGFATYSLTQGQPEPTTPPSEAPLPTAKSAAPTSGGPASAAREPSADDVAPAPPASAVTRDVSKLSPFNRQMLFSAQRGADWLFRMNGVKGRFLDGHLPAVRADLEGDHYLRQAGAAMALARAAR